MPTPWSIPRGQLGAINDFLGQTPNAVLDPLREIVERLGGVERINRLAEENGALPALRSRLRERHPAQADGLEWLQEQAAARRFVALEEYVAERCPRTAGGRESGTASAAAGTVTLEISALQYFPWLLREARQAIERRELMPGRYIRVRAMKEQEADGDLPAVAAAMQVLGTSWVEALDTKGSDGANVHLGGPETITGYFGGIGEPNAYPYRWAEELLHYYTQYGVREVLNINTGTVLVGYLLYRLGVDVRFKISVFLGNDNPFSVLWTLLTARLLARPDGSTPLSGFNLSNSVDNRTIELTAEIRRALGFEEQVRIEHHVLESYRNIVRQPYDRLEELVEVAAKVANLSAKHEGGVPEQELRREHPSDILEYFLPRTEVESRGLMPALERNYLDKHDAVQRTAVALLERGLAVQPAPALHAARPGAAGDCGA